MKKNMKNAGTELKQKDIDMLMRLGVTPERIRPTDVPEIRRQLRKNDVDIEKLKALAGSQDKLSEQA